MLLLSGHNFAFRPSDPDPLQPDHGPTGALRVQACRDQGRSQRPLGHPVGWEVQGAAGSGFAAPASPRAFQRPGEDREAASDALPHAHQPGDAGVRLPDLSHAPRDPIHGRTRI